MAFDDVEVNPDGSYAFDALEFYEDGRSLLQWFEPTLAAPKKKTPAKLEAATPPRKPRAVDPMTTPLKCLKMERLETTPLKGLKMERLEAKPLKCLKMERLEAKPTKLFEEPRPLTLRVIVGGVEVVAGGRV